MAAPAASAMHTTFKEIKIHTAKCDECNKHNSVIIYRCMDCSQQCCTPCWNKKGGDGEHLLGNGSMPGPVPVILKAEDYEKRKATKKSKSEVRKKEKLKAVTKATIIKNEEADDEHSIIETPTVARKIKPVTEAVKKPVKTKSRFATLKEENASDTESFLQPTPKPRPTVKASRNASKGRTLLSRDKASDGDVDTPSDPICSDKKRKRAASCTTDNTGYDEDKISLAIQRAAAEGRKRIRTSSSNDSSSPTEPHSVKEDQTAELANFLVEFSRGRAENRPTSPSSDSNDLQREADKHPGGAACQASTAGSFTLKQHRPPSAEWRISSGSVPNRLNSNTGALQTLRQLGTQADTQDGAHTKPNIVLQQNRGVNTDQVYPFLHNTPSRTQKTTTHLAIQKAHFPTTHLSPQDSASLIREPIANGSTDVIRRSPIQINKPNNGENSKLLGTSKTITDHIVSKSRKLISKSSDSFPPTLSQE